MKELTLPNGAVLTRASGGAFRKVEGTWVPEACPLEFYDNLAAWAVSKGMVEEAAFLAGISKSDAEDLIECRNTESLSYLFRCSATEGKVLRVALWDATSSVASDWIHKKYGIQKKYTQVTIFHGGEITPVPPGIWQDVNPEIKKFNRSGSHRFPVWTNPVAGLKGFWDHLID